jgi:hypothetical protein
MAQTNPSSIYRYRSSSEIDGGGQSSRKLYGEDNMDSPEFKVTRCVRVESFPPGRSIIQSFGTLPKSHVGQYKTLCGHDNYKAAPFFSKPGMYVAPYLRAHASELHFEAPRAVDNEISRGHCGLIVHSVVVDHESKFERQAKKDRIYV